MDEQGNYLEMPAEREERLRLQRYAVRSQHYAVGERILQLMRDFLGDNQNKAQYRIRARFLTAFIKDPTAHGDHLQLKEINTCLQTVGPEIDRKVFLDEQFKILLLPKTDLTTIDRKAVQGQVFSKLSLRELEKYAAASPAARKQVNQYYESLFTQAKLSDVPDKAKIFRLIQEHKIEELMAFLIDRSQMNRLNLDLFEPIGVFDPLLYLNIYGHQNILNYIYGCMTVWNENVSDEQYWKRLIRIQIRTGQLVSLKEVYLAQDPGYVRLLLTLACEYEHRKAVRVLCKEFPALLSDAITAENLARVKTLVEHGANPVGNPYYLDFREYAISLRRNEIAKYLIDKSMNQILAKDGNRGHIFVVTCQHKNIDMLRYLCQKISGKPGVKELFIDCEALSDAVEWGNVEAVELLLNNGFPIIAGPGFYLRNALTIACKLKVKHHDAAVRIVDLILANGFKLTRAYGAEMIWRASQAGNTQLVTLLLQKGAVPYYWNSGWQLDFSREQVLSSLKTYTENNPKHTIAKRLLNVFEKKEGEPPLTRGERFYLWVARFFGTELGVIYKMSGEFIYPKKKADENTPLLIDENSAEGETEQTPPSSGPSQTVRGQLPWLEEVAGQPREFKDETAFFERRTPPASPRFNRPENITNDNNKPADPDPVVDDLGNTVSPYPTSGIKPNG